jgi:hypothetical protein
MAQITSREELHVWLKDKPADWAQVIAARAALRVLPSAFVHDGNDSDKWMKASAIAFFRAVALPLIVHDFPARDMSEQVGRAAKHFAKISAHSLASHAIGFVLETLITTEIMTGGKFQNTTSFAWAAINAETQILGADPNRVWLNVTEDCNWLESDEDPDTAVSRLRNYNLIEQLGFDGVGEWASASKRLYNLDPTYEVWLKLYDRRISGEVSAFDIPGDTDRTYDKAILARLADATDEDFWHKGATYVNTTLQSWIDDAQLTAELESIVRKLEAGADTRFGSPEEHDARTALRAKLVAALPPAHATIGHNHPPEGIDPAEAPILPPAIREEAKAMLGTLDQPAPNALAVAQTLTLWSKIKSTFQHDEFSKNFSGELGTSAARGIVFILISLCLLGLAWLKVMFGI